MSNNNPQSVGVLDFADLKKNFPRPHDKFWTVEEVAALTGEQGTNGSGPPATPPNAGVKKRRVSGRYEGTNAKDGAGGDVHLELRVDVDGRRPVVRVSGDFFKKSGGALTYLYSFVVSAPHIGPAADGDSVTIKGFAVYEPKQKQKPPHVVVTIRRVPAGVDDDDDDDDENKNKNAPPAKVTFSEKFNGPAAEEFECAFASRYFRTVQYEVDTVEGTKVSDSYDAPPLTPGGPARPLTFPAAYAEAGIKMEKAGEWDVIPEATARHLEGDDGKWDDSELYSSMLTHFSLVDLEAQEKDTKRERQWKVWLLVATEHVSPTMRGIMFNHEFGRQRQGCAVFYEKIKGDQSDGGDESKARRAALRTYVHELGHCFNLRHSWEKFTAEPQVDDSKDGLSDSLSFMNYVERYTDGKDAYWDRFTFEFDDPELEHLRHGFRDYVIMGGNNFGQGAAESDSAAFGRPAENDSGLVLELRARRSFMLCEPVVIELKLYKKGAGVKIVHESIHPDHGFVHLAIRKPNGRVVPYSPLGSHCVAPTFTDLCDHHPSIYASAYVGYGREGFYFGEAGFYQIFAVYHSKSGAEVVSEPLTIRVRNPHNEAEEEIADLYYGHDEGKLFCLLGSDSEHLSSGNKSLDTVLDKYGDHPLAVHAHVVKGVNAGRRFKRITEGKRLAARPPDAGDSERLLSQVVDSAIMGEGFFRRLWDKATFRRRPAYDPALAPRLDNITLNMCVRRLARAKKRMGDERGADQTIDAALAYFESRLSKPHVLARVRAQLEKTRRMKY